MGGPGSGRKAGGGKGGSSLPPHLQKLVNDKGFQKRYKKAQKNEKKRLIKEGVPKSFFKK